MWISWNFRVLHGAGRSLEMTILAPKRKYSYFWKKCNHFGVVGTSFFDFQAVCGMSGVCLWCLGISWGRLGVLEVCFQFRELYFRKLKLKARVRRPGMIPDKHETCKILCPDNGNFIKT